MFEATTATKKLLKLHKRIRAVAGGTSASKTISILLILVDYAQTNYNKTIHVVSESYPHLLDGAIKDFQDILRSQGYWQDSAWNDSKHEYMFETGSRIKFMSVDRIGKARGPRRHVLFVNEANNIPYDIFDQLRVRTSEVIWLDWNPTHEFWYYTEIKDKIDHDFETLTYKDNEALEQSIIDDIESHRSNHNWWLVYGEGKLGVAEGRVYKDWLTVSEIPHEARLERYGLDFGYSNDPTAIVAIYYYNGGYILDEITYLKGLSNKQIADILINQPRALVIADSAEPKSIDEISRYGISIQPATKGQGSISQGIQYVQQQRISVTNRSRNILKEYQNYFWQTDKEGKVINEPDVIFNHAMDALRYGFNSLHPTMTPVIKRYDRNKWAIG